MTFVMMTSLFYEQALIAITKTLKVQGTIKRLKISDPSRHGKSYQYRPNQKDILQFYEIIVFHPTIKYVGLWWVTQIMEDILIENKEALIALNK